MPFGSVPILTAGSIGMSLLSCGHAGAEAVACGHAGPVSVTKPRIAVMTSVRAGRAECCIDVLMAGEAQYRVYASHASVQTTVITITRAHKYLNDLQSSPMA